MGDDRAEHWQTAWQARPPERTSWHQDEPEPSLSLILARPEAARGGVIDVGAGASPLLPRLWAAGLRDLAALDLSPAALAHLRRALADAGARAELMVADVLEWSPPRRWGIWHDRAVFHFLTEPAERARYRARLEAALAPGGAAIIGTFAPDGPERCSGLPVRRWSAEALAAEFGDGWRLAEARRHLHRTPGGVVQPFSFAVLERA